jgi:valyl-tRNA synthetase
VAKGYQPAEIESRHYQRWESAGYFKPSGNGDPYCIVIPPPNVTGALHMGHAFGGTIMDALARYHRMRGYKTLWQPGTDHAGIATQMVVERLLNAEGKSRLDLGREAFIERVWEWKERSGNTISQQLRRLAASVDWSRERFTMDPGLCEAVIEVFVRLYDEGLIYRGKRLVNWDPVLHTALSDLEVLSGEEQGKLWRFRYPLLNGEGYLVVATTRPETMLGDTAVAVHPQDHRFRALIGEQVRLPLAERPIPVIADEYVDPEFGTGCVKITPAHDFNDYEVGERHGLTAINIFDVNASLNDAVPERYRGLDRFEARDRVLEDLQSAGLLDGVEDHTLMVPRGDRSGAVVEPFLTDQWYVRAEPLAGPAIHAVRSGAIRFVPENWSKTYFEWMHNIQDWCISRQLWWGHRIPAWYSDAGQVYVARSEEEVREKHGLGPEVALRQDDDVLDTWFSSALWPFSTMGWPADTQELKIFYPTSVLVTGFDIIFFWVARMIMMGVKFMGEVPFREVYIHGLIRDHDGQKMSKSKGNVLDPLDIIDGVDLQTLIAKRTEGMMQPRLKARVEASSRKEFPDGIAPYGTDALRLTFAALATTGRDISFDLGRVEGYRNFCNKLWNAAQYVFTHISELDDGATELTVADRWIRSRLSGTIAQVHRSFAEYRMDLTTQAVYEFTWHEFCDWYLELTKPLLNDPDASPAALRGTRRTLADTLGALLRLLHPIAPYITEELWLELCKRTRRSSASVMLEAMPEPGDVPTDSRAEEEIDWIKGFIIGVRQIRGEMDISPGIRLPVKLAGASAEDKARAMEHAGYLKTLARLQDIEPIEDAAAVRGAATALLGQMRILVPLAGVIDLAAELERLGKQRQKIEAELDKAERKLANPQFAANAPEEIVAKEGARAAELGQRRAQLDEQIARLRELD